MRWGILGPLHVADDAGTEIRLPAGRLRVLLAGLLTQANHAVPVDELVELVWDGAPPAHAARTVRVHVVRLRRVLGPSAARIVTQPPGYLCRAGEDELDVLRFEKLCRQARSAAREPAWPRAAALLTEALGLWRGAPLADVPSDLLRQRELPRLDRLRVQAIEDHVDAGMHLDRYEQLVPQLHDLIARYPLRERPPAQLMRVLARAGRRAEALEVYQHARRVLAAELGIEPGPELRGLQERILAGDAEPAPPADAASARTAVATPVPGQLVTMVDAPAPATPAPSGPARVVPRELPMGVRDFTGRSGELRALTRLLDEFGDRVPGAPLISAIGGTAGVGKSALAVHWAHQAASRFPDGQLYVNLRGFDPSGKPVPPEQAIRTLLDALQATAGPIPAGADAQAGLYRSLLSGKRMLVVLDNARDAEQIRLLLPGSPGCMVLVTSRGQLRGLVACENAHYLPLDLLSGTEAHEMLSRRVGAARLAAAAPQVTAELIGMCARLPLALAIAAARISARPRLGLDTFAEELRDARRRLDALDTGEAASSIRTVFSWSYHALSAPAARMFRLLGLYPGPGISAPAAAGLAGLDGGRAGLALDELVSANLLAEPASGRYVLHDLLRDYAAERVRACDSEDERRAAIRRVLDHYLLTAHAAALFSVRHDQLPHLLETSAGVTGVVLADQEQARAWCQAERPAVSAAVSLAADTGFSTHAWQLAWSIGVLPEQWACWQEQIATGQIALAAAEQAGDELGRAYAHRQLGRALCTGGRQAEASDNLQKALALFSGCGERISQADTGLNLAGAVGALGRPAQALALSQRSLEVYQAAGHRSGQASALNDIGWYYLLLGNYEQGLAACQEAIVFNGHASDPELQRVQAATLDSIGYAHHHLGHYSAAIASYREAFRVAQLAELDKLQTMILDHLGDTYLAVTDATAARDAWKQALAIIDDLRHPCAGKLLAKIRDTNVSSQI
jgi:DNA-binding SARP family transcriptional activator/tetratricopeptide (TPR) repeat protein